MTGAAPRFLGPQVMSGVEEIGRRRVMAPGASSGTRHCASRETAAEESQESPRDHSHSYYTNATFPLEHDTMEASMHHLGFVSLLLAPVWRVGA